MKTTPFISRTETLRDDGGLKHCGMTKKGLRALMNDREKLFASAV